MASPRRRKLQRALIRTIAVELAVAVRQPGNSTRESERRRSPLAWVLIVPCNSRIAGDIGYIREVWQEFGAQSGEVIAQRYEDLPLKTMLPVDISVQAKCVGSVDETKQA